MGGKVLLRIGVFNELLNIADQILREDRAYPENDFRRDTHTKKRETYDAEALAPETPFGSDPTGMGRPFAFSFTGLMFAVASENLS